MPKMSNFKTKIENFFYQRVLKPVIFTSRIGRRAILGYTGKGSFVDYIYRDQPSGYNRIGYFIDKVILSLPSAKATKEKQERISNMIQAEIMKNTLNNKTTKVVDLGAGPARYLAELSKGKRKDRLQAICFDIDRNSIKQGRIIADGCPVEHRLGNITRLNHYKRLANRVGWHPNIAVVSSCYEFLHDGIVRSSIEDIYKSLEINGVIIVTAQLGNPNQKLFDHLAKRQDGLDWQVNYRKPFVIKKWLIEAGFKNMDIYIDKWNMYSYYIATKIGADTAAMITKPVFLKSFNYKRALEQRASNVYQYMRGFNPLKDGKALRGEQKVIMMASNNYLGLAMREEVIEAASNAIIKYGASIASSRILTGNLDIHEEIQEELADFLNTEDALVFSTGYMTNLGIMSGLLEEGDIAFVDRNAHASLLDGIRLSNGEARFFAHNDTGQLEKLLHQHEGVKGKLIVCDGVYSMDGDLAPLPKICSLAEKYNSGLAVDDGHGTGVFGENGRGTIEHFKMEGKVDLILGSLGKAFGSVGGFVAGKRFIIDHLRHTSRPLLFSTALAPVNAAAALAALRIIKKEPWLRKNLWVNTFELREQLSEMGYNIGKSEAPLVPIIIGDEATTYKMVMALEELGIIVDGVSFPAVKKHLSRIRIRVIAAHTEEDIDMVLAAFKKVGKKFGVI